MPVAMKGVEDALSYARRNKIVDENDYLGGYQALLRLFQEKLTFDDSIDVEIGAYAVDGWMPTILKRIDAAKREELNFFARTWKNSNDPLRAIQALADRVDLKTINNSVVGTSKFLHFLAPAVFPIWDSRIAAVFDLTHAYQINSPTTYLEYCAAIHQRLATPIRWPGTVEAPLDVSDVRKLEFCLFQYGKSLPKQAKPSDVA